MKRRIPSRWRDALLVAAIVASQALVVVVAWYITFDYMQRRVAGSVQRMVLASNVRYVSGLTEALGDVSGDIEIGDARWERLQQAVEAIDLPATGFVSILDERGFILAHPDLRADPELRKVGLKDTPFRLQAGGADLPLYEVSAAEPVAGMMPYLDKGTYYAATQRLNDAGYHVLVLQPTEGLVGAQAVVTRDLMLQAMMIGLLVLVPTGVLSWMFIRRHDRALRHWNEQLEQEVDRRMGQFIRSREALILGLAKLADMRDSDTGNHLERIRAYSVMIAEALRDTFEEIDDVWIARLRLAASMHDIGKVGVPDAVLLKRGKLTPDEYRLVQKHPNVGADTLISIREQFDKDPLVDMSIAVTLGHHERWDGRGYPKGLKGEAIPLAARIVSVADVYDALSAKRVYKPALSHEESAEIIRGGSGTQFDPQVVAAFERVQHEMREVSEQLQDHPAAMPAAG